MPEIIREHEIIERLFLPWRLSLGEAYEPYKGHVYRVLNHTCALLKPSYNKLTEYGPAKEIEERVAVAAAFHDVGVWLDRTFDYLEPSKTRAEDWLDERGRSSWKPEIDLMIDMHHKKSAYEGEHELLVEAFRKADLVDLTMGLQKFGLDHFYMDEVKKTFPYKGFHWLLIKGMGGWVLRHPLKPLPMMRK
jgi:predicted metal-dependent HD superfamily phosphohydrolase